jgi:hypothetical protein
MQRKLIFILVTTLLTLDYQLLHHDMIIETSFMMNTRKNVTGIKVGEILHCATSQLGTQLKLCRMYTLRRPRINNHKQCNNLPL